MRASMSTSRGSSAGHRDFQRHLCCDCVDQPPWLIDASERGKHFFRNLLRQLHVLFELAHQRSCQHVQCLFVVSLPAPEVERACTSAAMYSPASVRIDARAVHPSTSTFTVPSGSFSSCSTVATVPTSVQVFPPWASRRPPASARPACTVCRCHRRLERADRILVPTNSGSTMCGYTTTSRSGSTGMFRRSAGGEVCAVGSDTLKPSMDPWTSGPRLSERGRWRLYGSCKGNRGAGCAFQE